MDLRREGRKQCEYKMEEFVVHPKVYGHIIKATLDALQIVVRQATCGRAFIRVVKDVCSRSMQVFYKSDLCSLVFVFFITGIDTCIIIQINSLDEWKNEWMDGWMDGWMD